VSCGGCEDWIMGTRSCSDTDSDDEDAFEEALEEPATKEGTLKWAERFNRRYSKKRDDSDSDGYSSSDRSSYYENTSDGEFCYYLSMVIDFDNQVTFL
jgi:hypothetical protein